VQTLRFENGFEIRFPAFGRIHHCGVTPSPASCSAPNADSYTRIRLITIQVRRPVANASVSILRLFKRKLGVLTGV
jgi:hypothetical protein